MLSHHCHSRSQGLDLAPGEDGWHYSADMGANPKSSTRRREAQIFDEDIERKSRLKSSGSTVLEILIGRLAMEHGNGSGKMGWGHGHYEREGVEYCYATTGTPDVADM